MARNITHDIVASISGEDISYPKARILIDDKGNAAVFSEPGQPPSREFHITEESPMRAQKVTLETDIGRVVYRRRGSACSWALAKCRVPTKLLAGRWPEPEPEFTEGGDVSGSVSKTVDEPQRVLSAEELRKKMTGGKA